MLKVENLTKYYAGTPVVDALSFVVNSGDVLGFLGPNGAGKTTTVRMVCGFLHPDSGSISVCGLDIARQQIEAKKIIGYLPEGSPCFDEMRVNEFLVFVSAIRQLNSADIRRGMEYVVDQLSLDQVLYQQIGTLSKGFKRRVGLAQALIHDPQVLVMDEPTDGLDPNQKHHVRNLIGSLSKEKIVIISTHILEEVTSVCNRALIIAEGKLLADSTPQELITRSRYHNAVSFFSKDADEAEAICREYAGGDFEHDKRIGKWYIFPEKKQDAQSVYDLLLAKSADEGASVGNVYVETGQLEDVFRSVTKSAG